MKSLEELRELAESAVGTVRPAALVAERLALHDAVAILEDVDREARIAKESSAEWKLGLAKRILAILGGK